MQGLEQIALRKYKQISDSFPQFSDHKPTDEERKQRMFNKKFQKQHDFIYYMILSVRDSSSDYINMLQMTAVEIVDYYLSTQIHG